VGVRAGDAGVTDVQQLLRESDGGRVGGAAAAASVVTRVAAASVHSMFAFQCSRLEMRGRGAVGGDLVPIIGVKNAYLDVFCVFEAKVSTTPATNQYSYAIEQRIG